MYVVAGPSGSGKSSVVSASKFGVDYFNADDVAAIFNGPNKHLLTAEHKHMIITGNFGKLPGEIFNSRNYHHINPELRKSVVNPLCEAFIKYHIDSKTSFATETTLRNKIAIEQMKEAKADGFRTEMIFISTDNVEINIERVMDRSDYGGHSATEGKIREVYESSMKNIYDAIPVADNLKFYDNSKDVFDRNKKIEPFLELEGNKKIKEIDDIPLWGKNIINHIEKQLEIQNKIEENKNIDHGMGMGF